MKSIASLLSGGNPAGEFSGVLPGLLVAGVFVAGLLGAACTGIPEVSPADSSMVVDRTAAPDVEGAPTVSSSGTNSDPSSDQPAAAGSQPQPPSSTTTPSTEPVDAVAALIEEMTIEDKVGQLLMPVVSGRAAATTDPAAKRSNRRLGGVDTPVQLIDAFRLGGVLLLGHNVGSTDELAALTSGMQQAASNSEIGLFVAVDQEGGRVNRVVDGVTVFGSARSLSGDPAAVTAAATTTATQLANLGINIVLAPVADVVSGDGGVIGDRAYGDDPSLVAEMVRASILGLHTGGVAAAAKHWPGHGTTLIDSHVELPVVDLDRQTWMGRDRVPFAAAIGADVDVVMVAHLSVPALDASGDPATVSPVLIDDLLRRDLGFDGVVMTDALDMGAVAGFEAGELAVRSVLAGADILLAPPDLVAAARGLVAAVADQRLSEARLDKSVDRVLRLKQTLGLVTLES